MKKLGLPLLMMLATGFLTSCQDEKKTETAEVQEQTEMVEEGVVKSILTAEEQADMTPQ